MPRQTDHLLHLRILPDDDLVLGVAVRADDLVAVAAPDQIAHLRSRVDFADHGAGKGVPELDATVGGAATGGEEVVLVRGPGDGFDGGDVGGEAVEWGFVEFVPDAELVVVAAGGELPIFRVPAEAADFLFVAGEAAEVLVWRADVAVVDEAVA